MTQEEKRLLLVDLCGRIPYGVKVNINSPIEEQNRMELFDVNLESGTIGVGNEKWAFRAVPVENEDGWIVRPYLRPMSSMTEEEEIYYNTVYTTLTFYEKEDWLLEHHFDYRVDPVTGKGMIDMGLAEEAPEWMYNKEESKEESEIPIPKTVDEAVKTLAKILSDEDREYLLENGAISMHDSLGRWIRNEWGLWTGSELKDELMNMNKGLNHPDDMSNYIIEEFIKYWNSRYEDSSV